MANATALAVEITAAEPTFEVSASTVTAESGNVAAFEFTLKDGTTPEQIKELTTKVKNMVKYAATLGSSAVFQRDDDRVAVTLTDNGKIKAELKKVDSVNAGFMKVEPNQAPVGQ